MDDLESKLNQVMNNPELMQQIMSMAQSLGQTQKSPAPEPQQAPSNPGLFGDLNPAMLAELAGLTSKAGVDQDQKPLLHALRPYLPGQRLQKLEKAMRAAKLARFASQALNQGIK